MTEEEYRKKFCFSPENTDKPTKQEKALEHALDIRKFEIGLYWQRATYFWTLIAATFAGYFAILSAEHMDDKSFNAYVIACIGLIFSLAWYLVNRGSKFWQENWENHVDMLEDDIIGPLYKTILQRRSEQQILGPAQISVSQINQNVSLFTILIWIPLIYNVFPHCNFSISNHWKHLAVLSLTIVGIWLLTKKSKSNINKDKRMLIAIVRKTGIEIKPENI